MPMRVGESHIAYWDDTETLRTGLDKDAIVLRSRNIAHLEDDVLQASGLSCRPMNSCDGGR